jgi:photosystem II stability/assembly factor-like uncharacterized protein
MKARIWHSRTLHVVMAGALAFLFVLFPLATGVAPATAGTCSDFYWQNPLPQGNFLNDIKSLGGNAAIAVGDHGTILKTTDGGTNWESLPSGVDLDLYAVSAADTNTIWAVGDEGAILKTSDGGSTWDKQFGPSGTEVYGVSAVNANVAWAASAGDATQGGIIMRTLDGGSTWENKSPGDFPILSDVHALSADFAWLCGPGVISRTTDGGAHWDHETLPVSTYFNRIQVFDTNKAIVVGYNGVFLRTGDGGVNWSQEDTKTKREIKDLSFLNDQSGWIVGDAGMIAKTGDGGAHWDNQQSGSSVELMGVSARDANQVWVSGEAGELLISSDAGNNWSRLSSGDTDTLVSICAFGDRTLWAAGSDSTILKTDDGGNQWKNQAAPVAVDYLGISAFNQQTAWAVGKRGTIIHTSDGANWAAQNSGVWATLLGVAAVGVNEAWAAGVNGVLLKTGDGGQNWARVPTNTVMELEVEALDGNMAWIYGTGGYAARTDDGGSTWQVQDVSMGPDYVVDRITCLSAVDSSTAYATVIAHERTQVGDFSVVFKTTDGGAHWINTYAAGQGSLDLFAVTAVDNNTAWACGLFGLVMKTGDGGQTWVEQEAMTDSMINGATATSGSTVWIAGLEGNILRSTDPGIYSISPSQGMSTDDSCAVKIRGVGFQAGVSVDLVRDGAVIHAKQVGFISPGELDCEFDLRGSEEGEWDVRATNSNGLAYTLPEAFDIVSATRWYLAEGSTGSDSRGSFETWVLIQNPGNEAATATLTYLTDGGEVAGPTLVLQPQTRATINVGMTVPDTWDVSTLVDADKAVIAERSVYWNAAGGPYRQACGESIGSPCLAKNWYLAEGSTGSDSRGSFETWILLCNPNDGTAQASLTYMTQDGMVTGPSVEVPPGARRSINVAETLPNEWQVSTRVDCDQPIVAERAMYWSTPAMYRTSAHTSIGTAHTAMRWYLAEGSTGSDSRGSFETWVLVENPEDHVASVNIFYQTDSGQVNGPSFELQPHSRRTLNVASTVPDRFSVSTAVESSNPVVVERAIYWNTAGFTRLSATASIGAPSPSTHWDLAEGSTGTDASGSFETWVLVQNPNATPAEVHVEYMTPSSPVTGPAFILPAQTRITLSVGATVSSEWSVATGVSSNLPVVAERAMYWNTPAVYRQAASDSIGFCLF